jgi:transcriptional regulator with XRE-family HTH domain
MANREGSKHEPKSEAHARLGEELRALRKARDLSQRALAGTKFSDGHLANVENGLTTPSTDLLEHYVTKCGGTLTRLTALLDEVNESKERQRRARRGSGSQRIEQVIASCEEGGQPDPSALYRIVESDLRFTFNEHGAGTEVRLVLAIRAKVQGMNRYYTGFGYNGDHRPGVVTPESSFGCSVGDFHESQSGIVNGYFKLGQALSPDDPEPYRFSFVMKLNSQMRSTPPCIGQFKTDILRHVVQLQFTPPSLPVKAWWFDVGTAIEVDDDQPASQMFALDPNGYYYTAFVRPYAGRFYGIDYRWE